MRPRDLFMGLRGSMGGPGGPRGLRGPSSGSHGAIGLVRWVFWWFIRHVCLYTRDQDFPRRAKKVKLNSSDKLCDIFCWYSKIQVYMWFLIPFPNTPNQVCPIYRIGNWLPCHQRILFGLWKEQVGRIKKSATPTSTIYIKLINLIIIIIIVIVISS